MKSQQADLERRLERDGWMVVDRQRGADWWVDELWLVESTWHPRGYRLWITFLVDPMHSGRRASGEGVWAVGVTESHPVEPVEVNPTAVPIRPEWSTHLEELAAMIARIRDGRVRRAGHANRSGGGEVPEQ